MPQGHPNRVGIILLVLAVEIIAITMVAPLLFLRTAINFIDKLLRKTAKLFDYVLDKINNTATYILDYTAHKIQNTFDGIAAGIFLFFFYRYSIPPLLTLTASAASLLVLPASMSFLYPLWFVFCVSVESRLIANNILIYLFVML